MSQISYNNTPTLYLIPTPIGNLDDITLRAIKTLNEVEVIFSEDTRVTLQLLNHLNIKKKLISSHEYNEEHNEEKLLEYLKNGYSVGVVSDRGTPVISDPGYFLAETAIKNNYNVVSLPGATALIPALTSSGIEPMPFLYYGFLNSKDNKRRKELENLKNNKYTMIFYEAPHRINKTLIDMLEIFGNRQISVSREITKKFEEIYRGKIEEVIEETKEIKGEIVIVVSGNKEEIVFDDLSIIEHVNMYIKNGINSKEAIKKTAEDRNMKKSDIYNEYHRGE